METLFPLSSVLGYVCSSSVCDLILMEYSKAGLFVVFILFCFCFYCLDWRGTQSPPASVSLILELKVCTTTSSPGEPACVPVVQSHAPVLYSTC